MYTCTCTHSLLYLSLSLSYVIPGQQNMAYKTKKKLAYTFYSGMPAPAAPEFSVTSVGRSARLPICSNSRRASCAF